ncbi:hypothetical protein DFH06DRAFT_287876 [Mycena polygramma]|nr:hypothetical protein DFH06DRAFT_287876 [Mycena polygramma]
MSHQNTQTGVPVVSPKVAPPRRAWATIPAPTPFRIQQNPKLAAPSHPLDTSALNAWEAEIDTFVQRQAELLLRADGPGRSTMFAVLRARMAALEDRTKALAAPSVTAPARSITQNSKGSWEPTPAPEAFTNQVSVPAQGSYPNEQTPNASVSPESDAEPSLSALKTEWRSGFWACAEACQRFFREHPDLRPDYDATSDAKLFKGWLQARERARNPVLDDLWRELDLRRTHSELGHSTQSALFWKRRVVNAAIEALDAYCWTTFATTDYRSMFANWAAVRTAAQVRELSREQVKANRMLVNQPSEIDSAFDILVTAQHRLPAGPDIDAEVTCEHLTVVCKYFGVSKEVIKWMLAAEKVEGVGFFI